MTSKEMDSVDVSVKSIINNKNETDSFRSHGYLSGIAESLINSLLSRFEKFADKLKG